MKDSKFETGGGSQVATYPPDLTPTSKTTAAEADDAASQTPVLNQETLLIPQQFNFQQPLGDLHSLSNAMSAPLVLPPQPQPRAAQDVPSPGPRDRCESYMSAGRQDVTVPW
eukprot:scaffold21131_cov30-Prasinocladus_malaysianus.AAC.1